MFSTPSKLAHRKRDPPTHLIINQGGSDSDEAEQAMGRNELAHAHHHLDSSLHEDSYMDNPVEEIPIPLLKFGVSASETQIETQTLVVNAFHKVLSVLRQYVQITIPSATLFIED